MIDGRSLARIVSVVAVVAAVGVGGVLVIGLVRHHNGAPWDSIVPSLTGVDDSPMLDALGFNQPITVSLSSDPSQYADQSGQVFQSDPPKLAGYFVKAGLLKVAANPDAQPWWMLNLMTGTPVNRDYVIVIATRKVSGHTDEKRWTEGSIEYFAETVTYTLVANEKLADAPDFGANQFSLRLVLLKDPAVGKWQVDLGRGTSFAQDDVSVARNALSAKAATYAGALQDAITAARNQSFAVIQQRLAPVIFPTPEGTVRLPQAGLEFTRKYFSADTFDQLYNACATLNYAGHSDWRMPNLVEAKQIFFNGLPYGNDQVKDTPDRRIWGDTFNFGYDVYLRAQNLEDPARGRFFLDSFFAYGGFAPGTPANVRLTYAGVRDTPPAGMFGSAMQEDVVQFNGASASLITYEPNYPNMKGWNRETFNRHFGRDSQFGYESAFEGHTVCVRDVKN